MGIFGEKIYQIWHFWYENIPFGHPNAKVLKLSLTQED
jgi:hypothetical protein